MSSANKSELIVQAAGIAVAVIMSEFLNAIYRSQSLPRILRTGTGEAPFSIMFMVLACYFNDTFLPFKTHADILSVLKATAVIASVVILLEGHRTVRYSDDIIRMMPEFIYLLLLCFCMTIGPYMGDVILKIIT